MQEGNLTPNRQGDEEGLTLSPSSHRHYCLDNVCTGALRQQCRDGCYVREMGSHTRLLHAWNTIFHVPHLRFKRQTREQAAKLRNFAEVLSEGNLIQPTSDTGKCSRRQREGPKTGKVTPHVKQVRGGAGTEGQGKWGPQQSVHRKQCHDTALRVAKFKQ